MSGDAPACPVCGQQVTRPWFTKNGYGHWYCARCAFGFLYPSPAGEDLEAYYSDLAEGLSSDCSWETEPRHKIQLWRELLTAAAGISGKGALLDLGCGAGQFLHVALDAGWEEVTGIELSEKAAAMAGSVTGARVMQGDWNDVQLDPEYYAAIALLDMLEHAADARSLLLRAHALLRPGGMLLITVPNIRGLSLRCFGGRAFVAIPPEHVSYFSAKSLSMLLKDTGFEVIRQRTCDLYLKEWLRLVPRRRSGAAAGPDGAAARQQYARWYKRATGTAGLAAIGIANRVLAILGVGDQLVCIARKPK